MVQHRATIQIVEEDGRYMATVSGNLNGQQLLMGLKVTEWELMDRVRSKGRNVTLPRRVDEPKG